ncbi:hypothetical protein PBCV1_A176aL [Paramecium bursaria Chlorella virus 1]|uniref:Uncharacterized protein n=1 Tax=Paramecium bursaria Chlorella virus 1 TaxID=10506 RepID=F8TTZ1_PBCV1|nr:hypothetical protein PBCV1_A176aL [Paramecium bursaria Chlorella virus 1]AEI70052.1 hypothetical protein [Paramecium bursaria Chlorella virus 1]
MYFSKYFFLFFSFFLINFFIYNQLPRTRLVSLAFKRRFLE